MKIRQHFTKICVGTILLSSLAFLTLGPKGPMASATEAMPLATCTIGTPCTSGTIPVVTTPGALTGSTGSIITNNGTPVTLTGNDQTVPFAFPSTITDARGTATGWNISATATAVTFTAGGLTSDPTLDTSSPVVVACSSRSTCSNPSGFTTGTPGADLVTAPVTLVSATTGLGAYSINIYGSIFFPAAGGAPTGGGDISVTIASGP